MRKQILVSCGRGDLWDRLMKASNRTGLGRNEIVREVLEIYLDKWLEAQQAKMDILARQGVSVPVTRKQRRKKK